MRYFGAMKSLLHSNWVSSGVVALVFIIGSLGSGFGAVITHVVQLGPYTTPTSLYGVEITASVVLPKFDPSLGILNGVTISVQNSYVVEAAGETNTGLALPRAGGGYDWIGSYGWFVDVGFTWIGPGFAIESKGKRRT